MRKQIPPQFRPENEYSSHRPLLYLGLENTNGLVCEFGCGNGSTPVIDEYCKFHSRGFWSFENNLEWSTKFPSSQYLESWGELLNVPAFETGLLFIDCKPGEIRKDLLIHFADYADIIIIHDTEPGAEYVYHLKEALSGFTHRFDLHIFGYPSTTAVSNSFDFKDWETQTEKGHVLWY